MKTKLKSILAVALCSVAIGANASSWPVPNSDFTVGLSVEVTKGDANYMDYNHLYLLQKGDFDTWEANSGLLADLESASMVAATGVDQGDYSFASVLYGSVSEGTFSKLPPTDDQNNFLLPFDPGDWAELMIVAASDKAYYAKYEEYTDYEYGENKFKVNVGVFISGDPKSFTPAPEPVPYLDWDDVNKEMTNAVCKAGKYTVVTNEMATFEAGTTYVVLGNVTNTASRITVNGTVDNPTRLILCDGAELVAKKGVNVAPDKALVICGQTGGTGVLEAAGGGWCSGIGGGGDQSCGTVTINGGTVTATGGDFGAGIGGGSIGAGGTVTINGGTVTATGDYDAAGIGKGDGGNPGTVNFGTKFSVLAGDDAASAQPVPQDDYVNDHSARYVHIAPPEPEGISAVSAEGWLDLTVGDRVAADAEPIVADPKWGNGKKAFVKIDGEDPAREYPELSIDKWFTSALTAGRYGMKFTSGETNETAVFWKTGEGWEVLDLPPYSTAGIEFQADKTYLALGQYEFAGTAPLTVVDGAKFEYGTGAGFKGGKLEMPRRYAKVDAEGGLYQIVEKIKGCEDNPWEVGVGVEAYTNGTDNLVIVGTGTIADLSEIPSEVKRGIAAITIGDGVTDAAAGVFFGFDKVAVTLPDNWKGELPDEKDTWCGATNVELTRWPMAVKNVKVQQRYPWNGKVDVDFDLTGEGDVKVKLSVTVDGKKIKNPTVTGETTFELGKGKELKDCRLTWDAKADFGDAEKHEKIKVKLTAEKAEAN